MHAILFDIDGTLINSRGAGRTALAFAFAQGFDCDNAVEIEMSGRTDRSIARDWFAAHGLEDSGENWAALSQGYLEHLPQALGERAGHVLPGVVELLAALTQLDDTLLGLLTGNTPEGARIKLQHFGIWEHFDFGAYGDVHLDRDSVAADAMDQVRARTEIPREKVLVVGDTPYDIRCARHIGARAIAVLTGWHSREELTAEQPDALLEDLSDTEAFVSLVDKL